MGILLLVSPVLTSCTLFGKAAIPVNASDLATKTNLTVFAAASLTEVFNTLAKEFIQTHPEIDITFNYAGSQQLVQQLAQGASADIFASAAPKQMDEAVQSGRVDPSDVHLFAGNQLVVVIPKNNPAGITNLAGLARPGIKVILAAENVPAGQYAIEFLIRASQSDALGNQYQVNVLKNVVSYEDNVKNVVSKVQLGEADAGIVYTTDAISRKSELGSVAIPPDLNVTAQYPIAVIKDSKQLPAAQEFLSYITSPAGQRTLENYGFTKP